MARVRECSNKWEFKLFRDVKERVQVKTQEKYKKVWGSQSSSSRGLKLSELYCTTGDTTAVLFIISDTNFITLSHWE